MSVEKVKVQMISIPSVPKLLKHSQSECPGKLPDIKGMKIRQTLDPQSTYKIRNINRCGSLISPSKQSIMATTTNFGPMKRQPTQRQFFKSQV